MGEIVETDAGEVGNDDGAGHVGRIEMRPSHSPHILHRLLIGGVQILAARLHFDEYLALPEAVGVSGRAIRELDAMFKGGDRHGVDAEHGEELLQETLRLTHLVVCVLPAF